MTLEWQPDLILVGSGGDDPCVAIFEADIGETRKLIRLQPGHSAYAIAIDTEQEIIAVGTKSGLIYLVTSLQTQDLDDPTPNNKLVQGASILSVCWSKKTLLVVSDIAGRCLVWHTKLDINPQPLKVMEGDICCLLNLKGGKLAGLSSTGQLHFWKTSPSQLVHTVNVPAPPPIKALVRMLYWQSRQALVFPGPEGSLTIFELEDNRITKLDAHNRNFYAISSFGEDLLTVGMEDGRLRIWQPDTDKPIYDLEAPKGVISASSVGDSHNKILLIDRQGTASLYILENDNLRLLSLLRGKDYRVIVTPDPEKIRVFYAQQREDEIRDIFTEIRDKMGRAPTEVIDRLHSRLIKLGYEHISLMIRGEQAEQEGDLIEALKCRSSMMRILPAKDPKTCISLEKYASLLERLWHLTEAVDIYKRIVRIEPTYQFVLKHNVLARNAELVKNKNFVIEPDISIQHITDSANIIGKEFIGRYIIKRLQQEPCGSVGLTAEAIAEKYNMVRKSPGKEGLPPAITERVWWISREDVDEIDIVAFGDGQTNTVKGLQFALQISSGDMSTVVFPLIIFDWRVASKSQFMEENNDKSSNALKSLRGKATSNLYVAAVHGALRHTLRLLITENLSKKRRKG